MTPGAKQIHPQSRDQVNPPVIPQPTRPLSIGRAPSRNTTTASSSHNKVPTYLEPTPPSLRAPNPSALPADTGATPEDWDIEAAYEGLEADKWYEKLYAWNRRQYNHPYEHHD